MSERSLPIVVNQDPFSNSTFVRQFEQAHAQNLARRLPEPPALPAPRPVTGRKTFDTRKNWRPEPLFGE